MQSAEVEESRTSLRLLGLKSEGTVSETGKLGGKQIGGSHRSPSRIVKHMELLAVGRTRLAFRGEFYVWARQRLWEPEC